jgi:MFS family permease
MRNASSLRSSMPILVGAGLMLTISMGIRQTFGLFVQPISRDLALTVSQLTLALSIQNLAWGLLQPLTGALVVRHGFRPILLTGAVVYIIGLGTWPPPMVTRRSSSAPGC